MPLTPGAASTHISETDKVGRVVDEHDRERLARTFDAAAALYQRARPDYPEELYDRLLEVTGLRPPSRLLEIGCATGKATLPLAARGYHIVCVEPGAWELVFGR